MIELGTSSASSLYVSRLESAYKSFSWVRDPDFALLQDIDIYETIMKDANTAHAVRQRKHKVAGRKWRCVPASDTEADKRAAAIIEALLREIKSFASARLSLAEAVFRGSAWAAISGEWDHREPAGEAGLWWAPTRIKDVSKLRMRLMRGPDDRLEWNAYSVARSAWEPLAKRRAWMVHVVYDQAEDALEHGRGLGTSIYYYQWAKGKVLREGLTALETWSRGIIEAKIDGMRQGSATSRTNVAIARTWLNVLDEMRSRHVIAHDSRDEVGVIQGPAEGYAGVVAFLNYLDNGIVRSCLGSVLPTGGDLGTGSLARSETEADSTNDLIAFDQDLQADAITDDVIGLTWRMNRAPLARAGLARAHPPRFELFADQHADPQKAIAVIEGLQRAHVPLKRDEVYEQTGFTPPTENDDVFEAPEAGAAAPAQAGSFASFAAAERCPDGTFKPEGGDCGEHGPGEEEKPGAKKPKAEEKPKAGKRAPAGSQLPSDTLKKLKALGVKKLPQADIPVETVEIDLSGDVDSHALIKWRDTSGKKQSEYSAVFHERNAAVKFARTKKLEPLLDAHVRGLEGKLSAAEPGSREHAALTIALLIAGTGLRPGGEAGAEAHGHFGISTLRPEHVNVEGGSVSLDFIGKSGKRNQTSLRDPRLAASVSGYLSRTEKGEPIFPASAADARKHALPGGKLKDFRTLVATRTARAAIREIKPPPPLDPNPKKAVRQMALAFTKVSTIAAKVINNSPSMARKAYIHPEVFKAWAKEVGYVIAV